MVTTPGPRGRAALTLLPRLRRDPLGLLTSLATEYGERVSLRSVNGHPLLLLSNPDDVAHVLVSNQTNYVKAPTYRPLKELLGNGLLTNEGESWVRQRKLVQPMFARRHVIGFAPAMTESATRMLDGWASRPVGIVSMTSWVTDFSRTVFWMSTIGVSPVTVTVSSTAPTRNSAFTGRSTFAPRSRPSRLRVLNPARVNVITYAPGRRSMML